MLRTKAEKRVKFEIAIIGTVMFAVAALISPARAPGPFQDQAKPVYRTTGSEGTITGTVSFAGQPLQRKLIDAAADPVCQGYPELFTEDLIVTAGRLANAFVYVRRGDSLEWYSFEAPSSDAFLAHRECRFVPHVMGMQVQQTLKIANEDATPHNTHFTPKTNPDWNQSQPQPSVPLEIKFKNAEVAIPVKDNQHPWERAYIAVLSHPFFAVSARNGAYQISGLPPGQYTVVAWHERLGEQSTELTVGVSEQKKVDFTFSQPESQGEKLELGHGGLKKPRP